MDSDDLDLPSSIADALRSVPAADPDMTEAHIAAALATLDQRTRPVTVVTGIESRRRVMLSTAAAMLLVVGAGIGWVVHSPRATPVAADVSVNSVASGSDSALPPNTTVAKGFTPDEHALDGVATGVNSASVPTCTTGNLVNIDSVYIGRYVHPSDNHTYLVFRSGDQLEFIDKETCRMVDLSPTTTVP